MLITKCILAREETKAFIFKRRDQTKYKTYYFLKFLEVSCDLKLHEPFLEWSNTVKIRKLKLQGAK